MADRMEDMNGDYAIETQDLWRIYKAGAVEVPALRGVDLTVPTGYTAFLVRGVYLNSSHFTVRRADSALHVHASSLGRHAVPMKQQPLVVLLRDRPGDVYVTCSMAE